MVILHTIQAPVVLTQRHISHQSRILRIFSTTILVSVLCFWASQLLGQSFVNIAPEQGVVHTLNTDMNIGGSGVSFFDFDNDGWDDITFTQVFDSIEFYKNVEGNFVKISSFAYSPHETKQVLWVDYDNDGDNDIFIVTYEGPCYLLQNDGNFQFTDVTVEAGLLELTFNLEHHGVTFADYDRDGFLDFYIARYVRFPEEEIPSNQNSLFRNNGDGTFTNVTFTAGVGDGFQPSFLGVWLDVNNNGWPDLYVVNDRVLWGNSLYLNNGDGTFTDYTEQSGTSMFGEDPMCASFADFDNDGDLDLLLANGGPPTKPPRFYVNNGDSTFTELGQEFGINIFEQFMCSWGSAFFDADNDSYLDLYITTGLLTTDASNEGRSYLYMSNGAESFTDSQQAFDFNHIAASYSVARGDMNNDGFSDLVVENAKNFNSFIWLNEATAPNNYLKVTLKGTASNSMAIGSWIHVYAGGNDHHHYTRCGDSYISQDSQHHIFGLGSVEVVDSIVIAYPSGHTDVHYNLAVNQHIYFEEGDSIDLQVGVSSELDICEGSEITFDAGSHYSYLWSDGSTEQFLTTNSSGTYWVDVTNEFGVTVRSDEFIVTVHALPIIEVTQEHPLCAGENSGQIMLNPLGETTLNNVIWSNGMTGSELFDLSAGTYSFTATDIFGCSIDGSAELIEPEELVVLLIDFPVSAESNGGYDLFIFGGTPPYTVLINGELASTSSNSLSEGEYTATVIDANNCIHEEVFLIESTVNVRNQSLHETTLMYPNPLTLAGSLNIQVDPQQVIDQVLIFDSAGRMCYTESVQRDKATIEIPVASFSQTSGQYIVILISNHDVLTSKKIQVLR